MHGSRMVGLCDLDPLEGELERTIASPAESPKLISTRLGPSILAGVEVVPAPAKMSAMQTPY